MRTSFGFGVVGKLLGGLIRVFFTTKAFLSFYFLKYESFLDHLSALSFISRWEIELGISVGGGALGLA